MNTVPKQLLADDADGYLSKCGIDDDLAGDKDNLFEDQFDRLVLPERDLSTDGSSDDNEQIQQLRQKMSRDEALR